VDDFERFGGSHSVAGLGERAFRGALLSARERRRTGAQEIGGSHAAQIRDQTAERAITDLDPIHVDDGVQETGIG
jgi:hypothetical protein